MDAAAFQRTLQPAAFDGQMFHVARDEVEAGHRVQTTAIPHGGHVVERFGQTLRQFKVDAYVTGLSARPRIANLLHAMTRGSKAGTLVLPLYGPKKVHVLKASRAYDKDKFGWLGLTIEAQEDPDAAPGPSGSLNGLANQVFSLTGLATAALGPSLGALLGSVPVAGVAGLVNGIAGVALGNVLGAASGVIGSVAGIAGAIASGSILQAASAVLTAGVAGSVLAGVVGAAVSDVGRIVGLAESLRLAPTARGTARLHLAAALAAAPDVATRPAAFTEPLALFAREAAATLPLPALLDALAEQPTRSAPPGPFLGVTDAAVARHTASVAAVVDAAIFLGVLESATETVFTSRAEAVHARARMATLLSDVVERLPPGPLPDLLMQAAGVAATLLNRRITDLAPILLVEAPARAPALWWAHRLYTDPARATEITAAARAAHPGFLPQRFETAAA